MSTLWGTGEGLIGFSGSWYPLGKGVEDVRYSQHSFRRYGEDEIGVSGSVNRLIQELSS